MSKNQLIIFFFITMPFLANAVQPNAEDDKIIGKWMSTEKNVMVDVYKVGDEFKAKVIWFDDTDDPSRPMKSRLDSNNPKHELKKRKILGMDVLKGLKYNSDKNRWENGVIYDANSGRHWSSIVYFNDEGQLEVKGYWKFEFICETVKFDKAN
ncbi:MAG: DUF2147 domain-containing protein [Pelobium sp.]